MTYEEALRKQLLEREAEEVKKDARELRKLMFSKVDNPEEYEQLLAKKQVELFTGAGSFVGFEAWK